MSDFELLASTPHTAPHAEYQPRCQRPALKSLPHSEGDSKAPPFGVGGCELGGGGRLVCTAYSRYLKKKVVKVLYQLTKPQDPRMWLNNDESKKGNDIG
jgi:hypothetical protein